MRSFPRSKLRRTEISAPENLQSVAGKAQCSREFPSMNTAWRDVLNMRRNTRMNTVIERTGFDPAQDADNGNRFLTGNGYMGVRGTIGEAGVQQMTRRQPRGHPPSKGAGLGRAAECPEPAVCRRERRVAAGKCRSAYVAPPRARYCRRRVHPRKHVQGGCGRNHHPAGTVLRDGAGAFARTARDHHGDT